MYRVVIIGAGNIASKFDSLESQDVLTHAHAFCINTGFHLLGFYDKDYNQAKEAARKWECYAYDSLEKTLENADVVSCCVPDAYHMQILEKASKFHPKLVITEKPLARSCAEGEVIRRLYENKIPVLVNYSRRFLKEFIDLRDEIKQYGRFLKGVGYYGKGILHNGSHMIDFLIFLFGNVECSEVLQSEIQDFDGDCSKEVILKVQEGQFHMLAIDSRIATIFEMDLFFEKSRIRILNGGTIIERYEIKESDTYSGYYNYLHSKTESVNYSNAMCGMVNNAEQFLTNGQKLCCSLEDGLKVLSICMQIRGERF